VRTCLQVIPVSAGLFVFVRELHLLPANVVYTAFLFYNRTCLLRTFVKDVYTVSIIKVRTQVGVLRYCMKITW